MGATIELESFQPKGMPGLEQALLDLKENIANKVSDEQFETAEYAKKDGHLVFDLTYKLTVRVNPGTGTLALTGAPTLKSPGKVVKPRTGRLVGHTAMLDPNYEVLQQRIEFDTDAPTKPKSPRSTPDDE